VPPELCYTHPANPLSLNSKANITAKDDNSNCHHVTQVSLQELSSKPGVVSGQLNPYHFVTESGEDNQKWVRSDHHPSYH